MKIYRPGIDSSETWGEMTRAFNSDQRSGSQVNSSRTQQSGNLRLKCLLITILTVLFSLILVGGLSSILAFANDLEEIPEGVEVVSSVEGTAGASGTTEELPVPLDRPTTASTVASDQVAIPDAQAALAITSHWSLLNLVLVAIGILAAAVLLITFFTKRKSRDEEGVVFQKINPLLWRSFNVLAAIIALILFLLTQDLSLPIGLVDSWTIFHIIIIWAQAMLIVICTQKKTSDEEAVVLRHT